MNLEEYNRVKNLTYLEYCDYLQNKYGLPPCAYMTPKFNKNQKVTRTKDGLICHHKMENKAIMLSTKEFAMMYPYDWQKKENLVYCDYLEHLLLHVLITKYPEPIYPDILVGYGGVVNFLVPELNDIYSGFKPGKDWQKHCFEKVINDEEVYLLILQQFLDIQNEKSVEVVPEDLLSSASARYGVWDRNNNTRIYKEIKRLKYYV